MNTGLLNRWRTFVNEQRRALAVGQMLCLIAVATGFLFISPFAMACGSKDNSVVQKFKPNTKLTIQGIVPYVNSHGSPIALNAADIPLSPSTQSIAIDTNVTLAKLTDGRWIVGTYKVDGNPQHDVTFQGEIFSRTEVISSVTNKKVKVGEFWIAEIRSNDPTIVQAAKKAGILPGTFLRNVSLDGIPAN